MKKQFLAIIVSSLAIGTLSAQNQADIVFNAYSQSIDTVVKSTHPIKSISYVFKNTGDTVLTIDHFTVSCPCITARYSKKSFQPGETGEVIVTYDGSHKIPGPFHQEVIVASNAKKRYIRLFLSGTLVQDPPDHARNTVKAKN